MVEGQGPYEARSSLLLLDAVWHDYLDRMRPVVAKAASCFSRTAPPAEADEKSAAETGAKLRLKPCALKAAKRTTMGERVTVPGSSQRPYLLVLPLHRSKAKTFFVFINLPLEVREAAITVV